MGLAAEESAYNQNAQSATFVDYQTHPDRYAHWRLTFEGPIATLTMDVKETGGLRPGYALKLNSYDLGVDIELHDALQRIRFEHPEVRTVVMTSAKERIFCSGANIFMLGLSSHAWKVNFCKFTNETRNGIEDSSRHSGLKFLAACNGTTAGGGYELALACDELLLVDDRSSAVSLPEVPMLGVLPGTGGLTRLIDKRKVRHDHADIFCTTTEGIRGQRAKEWRLVDDIAKPAQFAEQVKRRALVLAAQSDRPNDATGTVLTPLTREIDQHRYHYEYVEVQIDRGTRRATITVNAPHQLPPPDIERILAQGAQWWPLQMARELDDALLMLRTNELAIGTWLLKTQGSAEYVLLADATLMRYRSHWFVREVIGMLRRTLARLEVSSRTLFALIEPGSCFAGTLFELALAADRIYMLQAEDGAQSLATQSLSARSLHLHLSPLNFGAYEMVTHLSRLASRFYQDDAHLQELQTRQGHALNAAEALALGLVTATPDELDWGDEIRIALEERASQSPDALTGMEANLRFSGQESMESRIFGRLSAWQNWIFIRPNAVGELGALKVYGTGNKAKFNWERV
jgi:benzoyl-CoA-dihydrodiol lyase